jgi:hypothetical protein
MLVLGACSSVADLGRPRASLAADEAGLTRQKVDEALAAKQYKTAWNLEAAAGTDQTRFERIALATLDAEDSDAEEMLAQVRKKFGGYSPELQAGVREITLKAIDQADFKRATDVQLMAADDAPRYEGAWNVYKVTPAREALSILERITDARRRHEEEQVERKGR